MIIDAHCHVSSRWYEPVETLLFQMDRCGIDKAVLIQLLGAYDNADMTAACKAHPDRFAFVAALDPSDPDPVATVAKARVAGASGLRLRPADRVKGDDPFAVWRTAERLGIAISCVSPAVGLIDGSLRQAALACPNLPIVLEHLGGLARPDVGDRAAVLPAVLALAELPNILFKFPGLGQIAPRKQLLDGGDAPLDMSGVGDLVQSVVNAFGAGRLMWGSDFPVVASREGYIHALNWPRRLLKDMNLDCKAIFGGTAARVFSLAS